MNLKIRHNKLNSNKIKEEVMRKIIMILFVVLLTVLLSNIQVNAQGSKMKYLVEGEFVDPGPLMSQ